MPFCAYQPDPLAHVIDAFTISWADFLGYAFPPFCILGKVLQKIVQDRAQTIVVAPEWPSKPWFTLFKKLCVSHIHRIYINDDNLCLSHRMERRTPARMTGDPPRQTHPLAGRLVLMVATLCGTRCNPEALRLE